MNKPIKMTNINIKLKTIIFLLAGFTSCFFFDDVYYIFIELLSFKTINIFCNLWYNNNIKKKGGRFMYRRAFDLQKAADYTAIPKDISRYWNRQKKKKKRRRK